MQSENRTILVIDDEPHITHVVALKLRHAGYEVLTAGDGEEGYEVACEAQPDLIITDIQMPYMNGVEMCQRLSANPPTAGIPVLVLTARGYALGPEDTDRTNIRGTISKPFSPREILARVEAVFASDGADAPTIERDAA
jgi:DNA-binding response OmpR family regulator